MNIFEILMVVFLAVFLYFGALRKIIKLARCRVKVSGVIIDYKHYYNEEISTTLSNGETTYDYRDKRASHPICTYTYESVKYTEKVDYKVNEDRYGIGDNLEFYINAKNPKLAVKTDVAELVKMIVFIIVTAFFAIVLVQTMGITDVVLEELALKALGACFVGMYLYNLIVLVILPIKNGLFSKGAFEIFVWVYQTIGVLLIGTIFLILGVTYMMGEAKTAELYQFIKDNVKLKIN